MKKDERGNIMARKGYKRGKGIKIFFNELQLVEQMLDNGEVPVLLQDSPYRLIYLALKYYYHELGLRGSNLLVFMTTFIYDFDIDFFGSLDELLSSESLSKLTPLHRDEKTIKFYKSEIDGLVNSNLTIGAKRLFFAMLWFKKVKEELDSDFLVDNSLQVYGALDGSLNNGKKNENMKQLAKEGYFSIGMSLDSQLELKEFEKDEVVFETSEVTSSKEAFDMLVGSLRRRNFIVINIAEWLQNESYMITNSLNDTLKLYKIPKQKLEEICSYIRFQHKGFTYIEIEDGRLLLDEYKELRDKLVNTHMTMIKTDFTKLKKKGFKVEILLDSNEVLICTEN